MLRSTDLKRPFIWNQRHILIKDRVWYVPDQIADYQSFKFPGWNHPEIFDQDRPICIEYCSGNGDWIANKAQTNPELNWVAIERKFPRVQKIWAKIKNLNLPNLFIICGEGYCTTQHYFPSSSVQSVYLNFPDPWPKTRHAKNRLVQVPFVKEIQRILKLGGVFTLVTDDVAHSHYMIQTLKQVEDFQSLFAEPFYVHDYPSYGSSFFEDLWRFKGKMIRYHAFANQTNEMK